MYYYKIYIMNYYVSNENLINVINEILNVKGKLYNNDKIKEKINNLNNNEYQKVLYQIELNKELNENLNKDYLYSNNQIIFNC